MPLERAVEIGVRVFAKDDFQVGPLLPVFDTASAACTAPGARGLFTRVLRDLGRGPGQAAQVRTKGRHDPCVGIRGTPVVEAMMALVLADHRLLHRAQGG